MKHIAHFSILAAFLVGVLIVPIVTPEEAAAQDAELTAMLKHFVQFAESRMISLNKFQTMSKSRMHVVKEGERYRATYQVFDSGTLSCKVRRSHSKTIPYVGIMKFNIMVMQAVCDSPTDIDDAAFIPVQIKPNRQLFSYRQGAWQ